MLNAWANTRRLWIRPRVRRVLAALLMGLLLLASGPWNTARAEAKTFGSENGFTYQIAGEYAVATGYTGTDTKLVIPATLGGKPVREIGESAFTGHNLTGSVEGIVVPDGVTDIGDNAFYAAPIKSVVLPDSVTSMGEGAFNECVELQHVTIPKGLTEIPANAFCSCWSLRSITVPANVTSIGSGVFSYCWALQSVTVPKGVTRVGEGAFEGCMALKSAKFAGSTTEMARGVFRDCTALTDVTLPAGLTDLPEETFSGCTALKRISVPRGVEHIESGAFSGCTALNSVTLPASLEWIGPRAFSDCIALAKLSVPDSVTNVGVNAFSNCAALILHCAEGGAADAYAYENEIIAQYPDGTTSVPRGAPYERVKLFISGKVVTAYAVKQNRFTWEELGEWSHTAQHPIRNLNSYPFIANGKIRDCYGIVFSFSGSAEKGDPFSVPWQGMVLRGSGGWSAGVGGKTFMYMEGEKVQAEVLFSKPVTILAWDVVPTSVTGREFSYKLQFYPGMLYFANAPAAQTYIDSVRR